MDFDVGFALRVIAAPKPYVIRVFHIAVHGFVAFGAERFASDVYILGMGHKLPFTKETNVALFFTGSEAVSVYRIAVAFGAMDLHRRLFHQ
jgi:hypothetical protein